jgi:hypothetical protein
MPRRTPAISLGDPLPSSRQRIALGGYLCVDLAHPRNGGKARRI